MYIFFIVSMDREKSVSMHVIARTDLCEIAIGMRLVCNEKTT